MQDRKKAEPQVTISAARFYHFWLISSSSLTSPKKVLRFLLSAEHFPRAYWLGFLLRPLGAHL
jgi:hypothetical protein